MVISGKTPEDAIFTSEAPAYSSEYPTQNIHVETQYDATGNAIANKDNNGVIERRFYDGLGRVTTVVKNLQGQTPENENLPTPGVDINITTGYVYDAAGQRVAMIDPNQIVTIYTYTALGQLEKVTENYVEGSTDIATNVNTEYAYDSVGNLITVTDALAHETNYGYDALNRQTSEKDALDNEWTVTYGANGQRLTTKSPASGTVSYAYDGLDRLTTITYPTGEGSVTFTYNAAGQRVGMSDGQGV